MDVPGAAKLSYCSCCRFGTWQGNSCLSRELQSWATAVGCSSGTWGWKILRRSEWSYRFGRYSCLWVLFHYTIDTSGLMRRAETRASSSLDLRNFAAGSFSSLELRFSSVLSIQLLMGTEVV